MNVSGRPRRTVVIAGGGPVGLALAALLGRGAGDLEVRLYEPRPAPRWNPDSMDLRVYALSRASRNILARLGAWDAIAESRASPYRLMRVWHGESPAGAGTLTFDSADAGEPDLGHIVEDVLCRDRIWHALQDTSVKVAFGTRIESVESGRRSVRVATDKGEAVSATVLIAADGSNSPIREQLEFPVTEFSYGQRAVVTHVATERSHRETAWQRFLPDGPLAFPSTAGRTQFGGLVDGGRSMPRPCAGRTSRTSWPKCRRPQATCWAASSPHPGARAFRCGPFTPDGIAGPAWRLWATRPTRCIRWRDRG